MYTVSMFNNEKFPFEVLSVLHMNFSASERQSPPRPYNVLVFRHRGNAEIVNGKERTRLTKNDVTFIPLGYEYTIHTQEDEEVTVIHFRANIQSGKSVKVLHARRPEVFTSLFEKALQCWHNKPLGYVYRIDSLLLSIFENLEKQSVEENNDSLYLNVQSAIDEMHTEFASPDFSIERLAAHTGYCPAYFRRIFKQITGKSPQEFLMNLRIQHAVMLLESGYYNVEQVSEQCGFESAKYFSTAFKAIVGAPPSKMIPRARR